MKVLPLYLARNRRGLLVRLVEDEIVPSTGKLQHMGVAGGSLITRQAILARFANENLASFFLMMYRRNMEQLRLNDASRIFGGYSDFNGIEDLERPWPR